LVVERVVFTRTDHRRRDAARRGPPLEQSAALQRLAPFQTLLLTALGTSFVLALWVWQDRMAGGLMVLAACAFLAVAIWRVVLIVASAAPLPDPPLPQDWPRYTILAALHDEAPVVGQLIERLSRIDYPRDRLQGLLVLEGHDQNTIAEALAVRRPGWLEVLVVPPGRPQTKPRALNNALTHSTGDLLTVYDAEDAPDPLQLREAAARFAADRSGRLACLQAPLRIRPLSDPRATASFIGRQFAAEYASLFETALPCLARLGLPFPLGGTSNHFRVDVLRAAGGWDAWNVTEDADLGFRLWSQGWTLGVISRPTWETPPGNIADWLPQRTRWLKGHMQTWGVHTRRPWRLGGPGRVGSVDDPRCRAGLGGDSWPVAGMGDRSGAGFSLCRPVTGDARPGAQRAGARGCSGLAVLRHRCPARGRALRPDRHDCGSSLLVPAQPRLRPCGLATGPRAFRLGQDAPPPRRPGRCAGGNKGLAGRDRASPPISGSCRRA